MTTPALQARGLVKRYGRVTAIDGADFDLYAGEVLAVVGDNGAGKSSLIKALSGALVPDAGIVLLDGKETRFHSPTRSASGRASRPSTKPSRWRRRWTSRPTSSSAGELRRSGPVGFGLPAAGPVARCASRLSGN